MKTSADRLEVALIQKGVVSKEQVAAAKDLQKKENIRLDEAIVKLGHTTSLKIVQCLAEQYDLTIVDLEKTAISQEIIDLIPPQLAKKHRIVPVAKSNGSITVAISSPPDLGFMDNLRFMINADVKYVLAVPEGIQKAIRKYYDRESTESVDKLLKEFSTREAGEGDLKIEQLEKPRTDTIAVDDEGPIIQLVSLIINKAITMRASDIHVEPLCNRLRIRYRIDGVCQEAEVLPKHLQDPILSRIKIIANMDISEKRRPQDGRIGLKYKDKDMDIRVSCLPSMYGESIVMRILEKSVVLMSLKNLGFYGNDDKRFHSIIKRPNGILLITGPTGSGKTTTLYATINELNRADTKIITAEDPVEYTLPGVNQSEVSEKIGLTFPMILRTMLRQDPNIILVGEIRDTETADTAIAAALTGHLVLSTLHTNDAPSAITRLLDMGVKPFLVATSLQGIMAQRLVRVICPKCKEPVLYTPEQLSEMGFEAEALRNATFYHGKGCVDCNNIGYRGRLGIYELIDMNDALRDMAYHMAPTDEIRKAARKLGMTTLKEDGLRKAMDGKISLEEVFRTAGIED